MRNDFAPQLIKSAVVGEAAVSVGGEVMQKLHVLDGGAWDRWYRRRGDLDKRWRLVNGCIKRLSRDILEAPERKV